MWWTDEGKTKIGGNYCYVYFLGLSDVFIFINDLNWISSACFALK